MKRVKVIIKLDKENNPATEAVKLAMLSENEQQVFNVIKQSLILAKQKFKVTFELLPFKMNLLGTTAGQYCKDMIHGDYYRFNEYIMEHNDNFNNTIRHEIAHYITIELFGHNIQAHGWEWKMVAKSINCSAEVTHKMNYVSAKQQRIWMQKKQKSSNT